MTVATEDALIARVMKRADLRTKAQAEQELEVSRTALRIQGLEVCSPYAVFSCRALFIRVEFAHTGSVSSDLYEVEGCTRRKRHWYTGRFAGETWVPRWVNAVCFLARKALGDDNGVITMELACAGACKAVLAVPDLPDALAVLYNTASADSATELLALHGLNFAHLKGPCTSVPRGQDQYPAGRVVCDCRLCDSLCVTKRLSIEHARLLCEGRAEHAPRMLPTPRAQCPDLGDDRDV